MDTTLLANRSPRPPLAAELEATGEEMIDRVLAHPFLVACADGSVTLDQLRAYLVQHGKYARYFTRYLCALISQLDEGDDVLKLAENLIEELGFGEDVEARIPHARIYADMLKDFEIDLAAHSTNPETQNLVDTMFMLCRQARGTAGLGAMCLGAEGLVPAMYARIMEGFRHCGVDEKRLAFFTIHIECDDDHAATMYEILARQTEDSPSARVTALNAGEIAVNARLRFFDAVARRAQ